MKEIFLKFIKLFFISFTIIIIFFCLFKEDNLDRTEQVPKNLKKEDFKLIKGIKAYIRRLKNKQINNNSNENIFEESSEPELSFIIPIHNKQKYLPRLISSLQNQLNKRIDIY